MAEQIGLYSHIEKYVGSHAKTNDFAAAEYVRRLDLAIRDLAEKELGSDAGKKFFVNGWGQIVAGAWVLQNPPNGVKLSEEFRQTLSQETIAAVKKGRGSSQPFSEVNVREHAKQFLMYPHVGQFFPFHKTDLREPVDSLNELVKEAVLEFSLHEGKLYLMIGPEGEQNIFRQLWNQGLQSQLEKDGYVGCEQNREFPHITLVNSDQIAKIKEHLAKPEDFEKFMGDLCRSFNEKVGPTDIKFTQLSATFSEDYTPFEEVVVANLKCSIAGDAVQQLIDLAGEKGIKLSTKPKDSYHLTIATKYRQPVWPIEGFDGLRQICAGTGELAAWFALALK